MMDKYHWSWWGRGMHDIVSALIVDVQVQFELEVLCHCNSVHRRELWRQTINLSFSNKLSL